MKQLQDPAERARTHCDRPQKFRCPVCGRKVKGMVVGITVRHFPACRCGLRMSDEFLIHPKHRLKRAVCFVGRQIKRAAKVGLFLGKNGLIYGSLPVRFPMGVALAVATAPFIWLKKRGQAKREHRAAALINKLQAEVEELRAATGGRIPSGAKADNVRGFADDEEEFGAESAGFSEENEKPVVKKAKRSRKSEPNFGADAPESGFEDEDDFGAEW